MVLSTEAILLCGGLGTRLRSVVSDRPKTMADIGGRPFLEIPLDWFGRFGIRRAILATGHLHEVVRKHFGFEWKGIAIRYSVEKYPLGTGGAALKALELASGPEVFVANGDTFFDVDLLALRKFHKQSGADVTIAVKPMQDFDRYGTVVLKGDRIVGFREKQRMHRGLVNGGVYVMDRFVLSRSGLAEKFSLEADFFARKVDEITIRGFVHDGYFIDMGIPEDYERACLHLATGSQKNGK